jgi:glycosyltransferase involved in cell wall biosynthesis
MTGSQSAAEATRGVGREVPTLSVVMPVFNEAASLPATIEALVRAVQKSTLEVELVLVDDGSNDGSADVAQTVLAGRLPVRLVAQENRGRFEARRAGLDAATAELVLLLDARVQVEQRAIEFVTSQVEAGALVWTAHVHVDDQGNPLGAFWRLIAEIAWSEYFDNPRTASFGAADFDRYPKGTTCFLAPRELLMAAVRANRSLYAESRHANDDTPLIRWIAQREQINVSPTFACSYRPRATLVSFTRHSIHRGVVFVDGHGTPASRFFPLVVAFYPVSLVALLMGVRRPRSLTLMAAALSTSAAAVGLLKRKRGHDVLSLSLLAPLYTVAHGLGMWRGLGLLAAQRLRRR